MNSLSDEIANSLKLLPNHPGVYQFLDANGRIIYIGKAKNIKNRVQSYFNSKHEYYKTKILVQSIKKIEYHIVDSEEDALLLENNLIKTHQPKYNVLLKDDKTYPWIEVIKEPFPRVQTTRKKNNKDSLYFGPFPNVRNMNVMFKLIHDLFPVRTCSLDLSAQKIEEKKHSVCLEYHIGNCKGPCEALQSKSEYDEIIEKVILLLEGKTSQLIKILKAQMQDLSSKYEFEQAEEVKKIIDGLHQYRTKSIIVSEIHDLDVFSLVETGDSFYVNYIIIKEGAVMNIYNQKIKKRLNESITECALLNISLLKDKFGSVNKTIISNVDMNTKFNDFKFILPRKGEKKKLLELSLNNISQHINNEKKKAILLNSKNHQTRILETIQKDFRLKTTPNHMECFDNSNLQGTNAVSACVVFKKGKPSKKDYRHFNVKTVSGPDDFETMREIVYRRYKRLLSESQSMPDLIIIDGGKGQLSAACQALKELDLEKKVAIVGIAKRLEEIFFPNDKHPLYLDKRSESLKVIQFMRNEAHRFGIKHHRNKRSKSALHSEFENIKGIGQKTKESLFKKFKTIEAIKSAKENELAEVIGTSKAQIINEYFKQS